MLATHKTSHKKYVDLIKNYKKSAMSAKLEYVSDAQVGIERVKAGKNFSYRLNLQKITDKEIIGRIKHLAIPPAWTNVWICDKENGHIQATGMDLKKRKQYRYHPLWTVLRNETKFHKMLEFGKVLPALRLSLEKDLSRKELCEEKVVATVISLMERTYIRVGNSSYEKMYGSYGLTTLKDKHVDIHNGEIHFNFKGKKSIMHDITLTNRKLAKIVQQCREIPGKELFQYYDENDNRKSVDSGMVNNYIKNISDTVFSAKDFRTWAGCLHFLMAFKNSVLVGSQDHKITVNGLLDEVSQHLGNTRLVCKKYYVHPGIVRMFEENKLQSYFQESESIGKDDGLSGLTQEENILMKLLETF